MRGPLWTGLCADTNYWCGILLEAEGCGLHVFQNKLYISASYEKHSLPRAPLFDIMYNITCTNFTGLPTFWGNEKPQLSSGNTVRELQDGWIIYVMDLFYSTGDKYIPKVNQVDQRLIFPK